MGDFAEAILGQAIDASVRDDWKTNFVWDMPRDSAFRAAHEIMLLVAAVGDLASKSFYNHERHRRAPLAWAHDALCLDLNGDSVAQWYARRRAGSTSSAHKRSAEGALRHSERNADRVARLRARR